MAVRVWCNACDDLVDVEDQQTAEDWEAQHKHDDTESEWYPSIAFPWER